MVVLLFLTRAGILADHLPHSNSPKALDYQGFLGFFACVTGLLCLLGLSLIGVPQKQTLR